MDKEKYIGSSKLLKKPDKSIKMVLKPIGWEKLSHSLQNMILSINAGSTVPLSSDFGESESLTVTQKKITEAYNELLSLIQEGNTSTHNILPFDGFLTIPVSNVSSEKYTYHRTISPGQIIISPLKYTIVANSVLNSPNKFYLKVEGTDGEEDTYYSKWEITTDVYGNPSPGDPFTTLEPGVVSKSEWYYREYRINKLFYNRSNKVIYAYEYATTSLTPITNIQVVETNAPQPESTSNPDHATKGSIVVDLEHDKLLTWDGQKWKALSGGGGQTVLVQSNDDSPSIVRRDTDITKLGKKVIPLGTSAANLFKNGVRENDSDVYDQSTYNSDDGTYTVYHIKYEFDLNSATVQVPANSTLKFEGGCIKNGTLTGSNTKVEVDGTYTIFDNISFSGTFRDSNLYATNFGAVGDMYSVDDTLTYKDLNAIDIKRRTGTDNLNVFKHIREFLNYSNGIILTFNGDFFIDPANAITITNGVTSINEYFNQLRVNYANNLTFKDGTNMGGWYFVGCNNVTIDGCSFVGFHEKHDFPSILSAVSITDSWTKKYISNGETVTTTGTTSYTYGSHTGEEFDNAFIIFQKNATNLPYLFGCSLGIYFTSSASYNPKIGNERSTNAPTDTITEAEFSKGLIVRNCHFEMLGVGMYLGETHKNLWDVNMVRDCIIENCSFDHIATQPLSLHARNCIFRDITIKYAWIPFDLSSGSSHCIFENVRAEACGGGWKQEHTTGLDELDDVDFPCGYNIFKNLYVDIDNTFPALCRPTKIIPTITTGSLETADSEANAYIEHNYTYKGVTDHYAIKIKQGSAGNKFRAKFRMPTPTAGVVYSITISRGNESYTWSVNSVSTSGDIKTVEQEAKNLVNYINNNKSQFAIYATYFKDTIDSSIVDVTIRAMDNSDYTISLTNALSGITPTIKRTPNAVADVAQFENCTFKWSRDETPITLRANNAIWNYGAASGGYDVGTNNVYTFIQNVGPANFKGCKLEFNRATFFIRDGEANTSWIRPYNFDECEINTYGRVITDISYQSPLSFTRCNIKYAGVFESGATKYPKGRDTGVHFHFNAPYINIKDSNIAIDYGTVINLPAGSEFINNTLLYKNPESCIVLNKDNVKVNNNTIICTLDGLTDTALSDSGSDISVFYMAKTGSSQSSYNEINNNNITTRCPFLYVGAWGVPNLSIKGNIVNITNSQDGGTSVMRESSEAIGKLLQPNNNIEICDNIITGTATWRILPDIIRKVNNVIINNDNATIFKNNTIGSTFKNNIDVYYVDVASTNLSSLDKISSSTLGKLSTTGTALSSSDKGILILTTDNLLYVWSGSEWRRQEFNIGSNSEMPFADKVKPGTRYFDTTNNILLISDGSIWHSVSEGSSGSDSEELPKYGTFENIPASAPLGTTYFDTTNNKMKVYNGSAWVDSLQKIIPDIEGTSYDAISNPQEGDIFYYTGSNTTTSHIRIRGLAAWRYILPDDDNISVAGCFTEDTIPTNISDVQESNVYYDLTNDKYLVAINHPTAGLKWAEISKSKIAIASGTLNNAPDIKEVALDYTYYDTVRQKLLTAKSEGWTDNDGNVITVLTKGTTAQRPATTDITEGFKYYNTESHKEQIYNGTTWIDIEDAASAGTRVDSLVPDVVTGSALSTTLAAAINKYYRYDTAVDTLTVTLPELVSSSKVQNVVVYLTAGSNADSTTITFVAATPTEGTAAPVYYQKSYDIEAGKTYEINALYNGAAWIVAAVEIITSVAQSSNSNSNSLLMGGVTPTDNNFEETASTNVQPENTEDI